MKSEYPKVTHSKKCRFIKLIFNRMYRSLDYDIAISLVHFQAGMNCRITTNFGEVISTNKEINSVSPKVECDDLNVQ